MDTKNPKMHFLTAKGALQTQQNVEMLYKSKENTFWKMDVFDLAMTLVQKTKVSTRQVEQEEEVKLLLPNSFLSVYHPNNSSYRF